jgi:uncharacterized membrane protein
VSVCFWFVCECVYGVRVREKVKKGVIASICALLTADGLDVANFYLGLCVCVRVFVFVCVCACVCVVAFVSISDHIHIAAACSRHLIRAHQNRYL